MADIFCLTPSNKKNSMKKVLVALALLSMVSISNSMDKNQEELSIVSVLHLAPFMGKQEEIKNAMQEAKKTQENKTFSVKLGTGRHVTATLNPVQNIVSLNTSFQSDSMDYKKFLELIDDSEPTPKPNKKAHQRCGCFIR